MNGTLKMVILMSAGLSLIGCSSDDESSGPPVSVITVSGSTFVLEGHFQRICYNEGGTDIEEWLSFTGNTQEYTKSGYASTNTTCSGAATSIFNFKATVAVAGSGTLALTDWVDGMNVSTTPPMAQDGSGTLAANESYTPLTLTITYANGGATGEGLAAGQVYDEFYIVDDTSTNDQIFMYTSDDASAGEASTVDPWIRG